MNRNILHFKIEKCIAKKKVRLRIKKTTFLLEYPKKNL